MGRALFLYHQAWGLIYAGFNRALHSYVGTGDGGLGMLWGVIEWDIIEWACYVGRGLGFEN